MRGAIVPLGEFFKDREESFRLFEILLREIGLLGAVEMRVSKSQVAFVRKRSFAWAWIPGQYLRRAAAPLVLTLVFPSRDSSPRWKSIVQPAPGRFTHHLELFREADIDGEVRAWLRMAWEAAA